MPIRKTVAKRIDALREQMEPLALFRGAVKFDVYGIWARRPQGASATILAEPDVPTPRSGDRIVDVARGLSLLVLNVSGLDEVNYQLDCDFPVPVSERRPPPEFTATGTAYATSGRIVASVQRGGNYRYRLRHASNASYWLRSHVGKVANYTFQALDFGIYVVGVTGIGDDGGHTEEGLSRPIELIL